ncbi:MAG: hypothetical protein AAF944_11905 [Bacteroidota bacterium]
MKTYKFKTNINCGNCVKAVTPQLNKLDKLENWQINTNHPDRILTALTNHNSPEPILQAVVKAGFNAELVEESQIK